MYHTPVRPETWIGLGRWPDEKKRKEINGTHPEGEQELSGELKRMGRGKKTERVQKIFEEKCLIFPSTLLLSFFLSFFSPLLLQSCYWSGHGKRPPVPTVVAIPTGPCMFGSDSRVRVTAHLILVNRSWSPEHVGRENWKKKGKKKKEAGKCARWKKGENIGSGGGGDGRRRRERWGCNAKAFPLRSRKGGGTQEGSRGEEGVGGGGVVTEFLLLARRWTKQKKKSRQAGRKQQQTGAMRTNGLA